MRLSARCLGHSPKFKKLAINNKPFECRSAVFLSPSFRQMLEEIEDRDAHQRLAPRHQPLSHYRLGQAKLSS
jgi:hypothetical protein